jgi:hypothetical protein
MGLNFVAITGRVRRVGSRPSGNLMLRVHLSPIGDVLVLSRLPAVPGDEIFAAGRLSGTDGIPQIDAQSLSVLNEAVDSSRADTAAKVEHGVRRHVRHLASGRVIWVKGHRRGGLAHV